MRCLVGYFLTSTSLGEIYKICVHGKENDIVFKGTEINVTDTIKNYRFKNICELSPREDVDCICDEYYYDEVVRNSTKLFQCDSGNIVNDFPSNPIIVAVEYNSSEYKDFILRGCDEISKNKLCIQSHPRTPIERCEYFNLRAVYNLNHTEIAGCS